MTFNRKLLKRALILMYGGQGVGVGGGGGGVCMCGVCVCVCVCVCVGGGGSMDPEIALTFDRNVTLKIELIAVS